MGGSGRSGRYRTQSGQGFSGSSGASGARAEQLDVNYFPVKSSREANRTIFVPCLLCPLTGDAQPFDLEKEIQTKEALSSARAAKSTSASEGLISFQCKSTLGN